jgi:hypothetical protein
MKIVYRTSHAIDTTAEFRHLKKLTCKGTLWHVFIRVYRLEIQLVMLVFRPSFVNCCLSKLLSAWFNSPPFPLHCVKNYTAYTDAVCKGGGGYEVLGLRQINNCRYVPVQVIFLCRHLALPYLIFLWY